MTAAALFVKSSSHTVPQTPWCRTSTLPCREPSPFTKRNSNGAWKWKGSRAWSAANQFSQSDKLPVNFVIISTINFLDSRRNALDSRRSGPGNRPPRRKWTTPICRSDCCRTSSNPVGRCWPRSYRRYQQPPPADNCGLPICERAWESQPHHSSTSLRNGSQSGRFLPVEVTLA